MTALVTGGASGIGREVAERLRGAGHDVVVWDLADADIICDVSDAEAVSAAMEQTVREHGVPTRVVASAGVGSSGLLLKVSPEEWQRVLSVNLTGTWLTLRAAAQAMVDAELPGSIVAVSSISGTLSDRDMGPYCVSKAGVNMLVKVAAVEWGTYGIRVNAVGPGATRTPMLPIPDSWPGWSEGLSKRTALGGIGEPTDVAEAIVGDIAPGDNVPKEEKARREAEAMAEMRRMLEGCSGGGSGGNSSKSNNVTIGAEVESLFEEYERGETPEAQLVKDCDKLEMLLQAVEYEKGADNPPLDLSEFFESVRGRLKTEVGRSWGAEIEGRRPTKRGCL